jgi:hypothetical protein
MKTKISLSVLVFFMMSCGSGEEKKQADGKEVKIANIKFVLKANNMKYLTLASDSTLVANEADASKAVVFEKIDSENGTSALKLSNGKYLCDDPHGTLIANRDEYGAWESFQVIAVDANHVNIRASTGKFVCADLSNGGKVVANRDQGGDWETFTIELRQ